MDHMQMFVKNDGTNEDIHEADWVLVVYRYNCNDNPLNVAPKKLYKNSESTRLTPAGKSSQPSPTEDASNLYSLYASHNIQNGMGKSWDTVLYCCKDIQREFRPILTTLKLAPEPLMEIKLCRRPTN